MAIPSGFQTPRPASLRSASASASSTRNSPSTTRSSVSSSSARTSSSAAAARRLPVPAAAKEVAKCLAYGDGLDSSSAASTLLPPEGVPEGVDVPDDDLAPLLELPDPVSSSSSSTVISAAWDDAVPVAASADGDVVDVEAPAKPSQPAASVRPAARSSSSAALKLPVRTAVASDLSSHTTTVVPEGAAVPAETPPDAGLSEIGVILGELQGAVGISTRSKELLTALVEVAAAELNTPTTSLRLCRAAFWGKVRVWVLATTVAAVAAIDVVLAAALFLRGDGNGIVPPT